VPRFHSAETRRAWRKLAMTCRHRVFDTCGRIKRGNPLCSMGCLGRRCVCGNAGCEQMQKLPRTEEGA
jgi:hypothetical protein